MASLVRLGQTPSLAFSICPVVYLKECQGLPPPDFLPPIFFLYTKLSLACCTSGFSLPVSLSVILHQLLICGSLLLLPHPNLKLNLSGSALTQGGQAHKTAAAFKTAQTQVLETLPNLSGGWGLPPFFPKMGEVAAGSLYVRCRGDWSGRA